MATAALIILLLTFGLSSDVNCLGLDELRTGIFGDCYLTPLATAANEIDISRPTPASVNFHLQQLKGVDDLDQTFTVVGSLIIKLEIECIANATKQVNVKTPVPPSWILYSNTDGFWKVPVTHENSNAGLAMSGEGISHAMTVQPFKGGVQQFYSGRFVSECTLQLSKFPFDVQTCWLEFGIWQTTSMIRLPPEMVTLSFSSSKEVLKRNTVWLIKRTFSNLTIQHNFHMVKFGFQLQRRSEHFVRNFIGPTVMLTIVQMALFLVPFGRDERVTLAITVLLAFAVTRSSVLSYIPNTPDSMLLITMITLDSLSSFFFVFYAAATCTLAESYAPLVNRKFRVWPFGDRLKLRLGRIIDLCVFMSFVVFLIITNVSIASQMLA